MRLHRFYVSQPHGEDVVIDDVSVLKQWAKVFRYQKGDFVILFNGDGNDYTYALQVISVKTCALHLENKVKAYSPTKAVTLYLSILKKDNFELVVQKATELGISMIVPILSDRSEKKGLNDERLHKIAIEASEQCGRGDILKISQPIPFTQALESLQKQNTYALNMVGIPVSDNEIQKTLKKTESISIFIGPEGGWSEHEESIFKEKGISLISLGKTTLRAETAAIVACAFMLQ